MRLVQFALCLGIVFGGSAAKGGSIKIDTIHLSDLQQKTIAADLARLESMEIHAPRGSLFEKVFGGTSSADVMRYLRDRVHYITRWNRFGQSLSWLYAENLADFWMARVVFSAIGEKDPYSDSVPFENGRVDYESPRVGVLNLGPSYFGSDSDDPSFDRLDVLVHEARHSDCPRIPSSYSELETMARAMSHRELVAGFTPAMIACEHVHVHCPKSAEKADPGCDGEPYGAYGVAYVFASTVAKSCVNCGKSQIKQAGKAAKDDLSRLLPQAREALLAGDTSTLDMSSVE